MASQFLQSVQLLKVHYAQLAAAQAKGGDLDDDDLDAAADAADDLEVEILNHRPQGLGEAISMTELLVESMVCGPRSDGLDVTAMRAVLDCMRQAAAGQTRAAA